MKRLLVLFFLLINTYFPLFAQAPTKLDSLLQRYRILKQNDTTKVNILNKISKIYQDEKIDFINSKKYAEESLQLSQKIHFELGQAGAYHRLGDIYRAQSLYIQALQFSLKAVKIYEKYKDTNRQIQVLNRICTILIGQKQFAQAEKFCLQALKKAEILQDSALISASLVNLGITYGERKMFLKEREIYEKALLIDKKDSISVSTLLNNIGESYFGEKKYAQSLPYYDKALKISEKIKDYEGVMYAKNNMARLYVRLGQAEKAENLAFESLALADSLQYKTIKPEIYQNISQIYELKKNPEQALKFHKLYVEIQDEILNKDNQNRINQLQTFFAIEQKEKENALLKKEQIEKNQTIWRQNIIMWSVSIGLVLVLVLLGFLYRANRQKHKLNQILQKRKEEIIQQKNELSEINELKDKLFSIIAHDFRGPLNSLQGVLSLLNSGDLSDEEVRFLLKGMVDKVNDTQNLLENLLNWAKRQMQGLELTPQTINLNKIIRENIQLLQPIADRKKVILENHLKDNVEVKADIDTLRVIVRNLISNAIKFTPSEGKVSVNAQIIDNQSIKISIEDTGVGISAENLSKLFDLKTHYTTQGTANEKGTGLGLILTKDFVELNGGKIWIESQENAGSKFYFTLPSN